MSKKYPFKNENSERRDKSYKKRLTTAISGNKIRFEDLSRLIVARDCITPDESGVWRLDNVIVDPDTHGSDVGKYSCVVEDLVVFSTELQSRLRSGDGLAARLKPAFRVIGSVAEGTQVVAQNELDLTMEFDGFEAERPPFEMRPHDPFHLYRSDHAPAWTDKYFDGNDDSFNLYLFTKDLLVCVETAVDGIFAAGVNPDRLIRATPNGDYDIGECKQCSAAEEVCDDGAGDPFRQCSRCLVAVSQSKIGVCLQFLYRTINHGRLYCSVDLVPKFPIVGVELMKAVRAVNRVMLGQDHPAGWFSYLRNYVQSDRIVDIGKGTNEVNEIIVFSLNLDDCNISVS